MEENEFANILLRLAEDDLRASRLLYKDKLYAFSVFHVQQAVEKATKALGILSGHLKAVDSQNEIGHKPSKIFAESLGETSEGLAFFGKLIDMYPDLSSDSFVKSILSSKVTEKDFNNGRELLLNPKAHGFEKLDLNSLDQFLEEIRDADPNGDKGVEISDENLVRVRQVISNVARLIESFSKEKADEMRSALEKLDSSGQLEQVMNEAVEVSPYLWYCTIALSYLSLLFFPHSNDTRYPNQEKNLNPYTRYTSNYPVVIRMNEIQTIVGKVLSALRTLGFPRNEK